jgi:NCS2 family nucleobase:cation symporter-2
MSDINKDSDIENLYRLNGKVPIIPALLNGLQHVLAMFVSNVIPIILITNVVKLNGDPISDLLKTKLIQNAMIVAGISSLIQIFGIWKIGSRLPIIMGISFTFLSVALAHTDKDYNIILGSILVGGIIEGLLGLFYKYWKRIISPIVAACVVIGIGISLLPVCISSFGGGSPEMADFGAFQYWIIGLTTLISSIIALHTLKSSTKSLAPLIGIIAGTIVSIPFGLFKIDNLMNHGVFSLPQLFPTGMPKFELGNIISFIFIYLVSATETIGDTSAICHGALNRPMTEKEGSGSLACDGFSSALASTFGCMSTTSFSQNVGLINLTKVVNRYVVATGALILVIAGFFPPIAALLQSVPQSVLGGCTILMFGQIFISGLQMLYKVNLEDRNITIASISVCLSLGLTTHSKIFQFMPSIIKDIFANNPVSVIFVTALLLDLLLPKKEKSEGNTGTEKIESSN